jgi:hypothetical protein
VTTALKDWCMSSVAEIEVTLGCIFIRLQSVRKYSNIKVANNVFENVAKVKYF